MRKWLLGVVYAAVLSSAALTLTPAGRVKSVTRLCCGLLCALALAGPLLELDMEKLSVSIAVYEQAAQSVVENAEEEAKTMERTYIEERCEAYILAKATETGVELTAVSVTARWDGDAGVWYPYEAVLSGPYSPTLSRAMEADLGIADENQTWEEGSP